MMVSFIEMVLKEKNRQRIAELQDTVESLCQQLQEAQQINYKIAETASKRLAHVNELATKVAEAKEEISGYKWNYRAEYDAHLETTARAERAEAERDAAQKRFETASTLSVDREIENSELKDKIEEIEAQLTDCQEIQDQMSCQVWFDKDGKRRQSPETIKCITTSKELLDLMENPPPPSEAMKELFTESIKCSWCGDTGELLCLLCPHVSGDCNYQMCKPCPKGCKVKTTECELCENLQDWGPCGECGPCLVRKENGNW